MEFPKPTIDVETEVDILLAQGHLDRMLTIAEAAAGVSTGDDRAGLQEHLRSLLTQAWEEGRWSPPGACMNPYGEPAAHPPYPSEGFVGLRLLRLREAAQAALAWVENMAPTVRRTALAEQLRAALGGRP